DRLGQLGRHPTNHAFLGHIGMGALIVGARRPDQALIQLGPFIVRMADRSSAVGVASAMRPKPATAASSAMPPMATALSASRRGAEPRALRSCSRKPGWCATSFGGWGWSAQPGPTCAGGCALIARL